MDLCDGSVERAVRVEMMLERRGSAAALEEEDGGGGCGGVEP